MSQTKSLSLLTFLLFAKALLMVFLILQAGIGLGPDEAQYWTWSRQLDWGYYSKPPGIAWMIWAGTQVFGNTEFGVRFHAVIIGTFISLAVYFLAYSATKNIRLSFYSSLLFTFSPLGFFSSFLAITDGGLALAWTLSCALIAKALNENKRPSYLLLGLIILGGALVKWPIYAFWLVVLGMLFFYPHWRHYKLLATGIGISLIGLLPSLIWNMQHDWVTFKHVGSTIYVPGAVQTVTKGNFWDFLGAQAVLVSPVFFLLLMGSLITLWKEYKTFASPLKFIGVKTFLFLAGFLAVSVFKKMQGNWVDFIYPTSFVFFTWVVLEKWHRPIFLWLGLLVSVVIVAAGFGMAHYQSSQGPKIPYGISPFKHNVGWGNLSPILQKNGYNPDQHFLVGDKYQMASLLSFYAPQQRRAYFLNLHGLRKNQFSFWPSLADDYRGGEGFFVMTENQPHLDRKKEELLSFYQQNLPKYFEEVYYLGSYPLFLNHGEVAKGALIFKVKGYNGKVPKDPELY